MNPEPTRSARRESPLLTFLNLKQKYKVELDESIKFFPKEVRKTEIIWNEYIPAYKGMIYLSCASPIELAYFSESIGKVNTIEKEMGNKVRVVKGDGEGIVYFPFTEIKKVFKLAGAKTNRKMSEAHKKKVMEALTEYRKKK